MVFIQALFHIMPKQDKRVINLINMFVVCVMLCSWQ